MSLLSLFRPFFLLPHSSLIRPSFVPHSTRPCRYERPILLSREPHASKQEISAATLLQKELSTIVNEFILKRGNTLNAQHLPPKLVRTISTY